MNIIKVKLQEGASKPVIRNGNMCDLGIWKVAILPNDQEISIKNTPWTFAEDWDYINVKEGDVLAIDTGVSMELPEGWFSYAVPRSSTFLKYGLVLTNSIGVIDHSYKGNGDTWKGFFLCTRNASIPTNAKLIQFQPVKDTIHDFQMLEVDSLDNDDRGGFGSTDVIEAQPNTFDTPWVHLDLQALRSYLDEIHLESGEEVYKFHLKHGYVHLYEYTDAEIDSQAYRVGTAMDDDGNYQWIWVYNKWVL